MSTKENITELKDNEIFVCRKIASLAFVDHQAISLGIEDALLRDING